MWRGKLNWLKTKLQNWLGITSLSEKQLNMWWDLNDSGHGAIPKWKEHERVIDFMLEIISQPENYKWSKDKDQTILNYKSGWLAQEHTLYHMLENHTRHKYHHPQASLKKKGKK